MFVFALMLMLMLMLMVILMLRLMLTWMYKFMLMFFFTFGGQKEPFFQDSNQEMKYCLMLKLFDIKGSIHTLFVNPSDIKYI